ncbi:MAG TPA: hypothetical protein VF553_14730 [Pyrinomonadaceae bacterium]|jgi:hypothetical protein
MPIVKKRNQQTESRLLLEADEPVELPPAEVEEGAVIVQFEKFRPYVPELLEALRAGATVETVPVMMDGSTFAVHCATRTFWVKLWHAANTERSRIERVQVISCLPSTRGMQIIVETGDEEETDEELLEEDDELGESED